MVRDIVHQSRCCFVVVVVVVESRWLSRRVQMMEAALALSEQKNQNMGELLTQAKVEKEEQLERWSREKKKDLEARTFMSDCRR